MSDNIILVGMPGSGKSTLGVVLAKMKGYQFLDSDLVIQKKEGGILQHIIERKGIEGFIAVENEINCEINPEHTVIATGGSAVYGHEAMMHFKDIGRVVYIKVSYKTLKKRLGSLLERGVVIRKGNTLLDLYNERCPLYEKYADVIVDVEGLSLEDAIAKLSQQIKE